MNTTDLPPISRKAFKDGKPQTTIERVQWMLKYCVQCFPNKGEFRIKCSSVYIRPDSERSGLYVIFKQKGAPFWVSVLAAKIVLISLDELPPDDKCAVTYRNGNRDDCRYMNVKWRERHEWKRTSRVLTSDSGIVTRYGSGGEQKGWKVDTGKRDGYGKPVYIRFSDERFGNPRLAHEAASKYAKEIANGSKQPV
jgi:hypothetical protein